MCIIMCIHVCLSACIRGWVQVVLCYTYVFLLATQPRLTRPGEVRDTGQDGRQQYGTQCS